LGGRKGIRSVKTEWWGVGVVISLERGADLHMVQLMPLPPTVSFSSKIQISFTFLVLAYPGCPEKEAVKWLLCMHDFPACLFNPAFRGWQKLLICLAVILKEGGISLSYDIFLQ